MDQPIKKTKNLSLPDTSFSMVERLYPRSLHQRTVIFLLVPIFLFLTFAGLFGYRAVRNILLEQWGETALANLERAAHQIDMQLHRPKQILFLLEGLSGQDSTAGVDEFILHQLGKIDGVISVKVDWSDDTADQGIRLMRRGRNTSGMYFNSKGIFEITTPVYNVEHNSKTVSMVTDLIDQGDRKVGRIEVILDFKSLISQTVQAPWWNVYKAYIVDQNDTILVSTTNKENTLAGQKVKSFGTTGILERKTLKMLRDNVSGTVFGPGRPPEEVSGFYRLKEAPWTLVVIAPGKKILQPIIHFRNLYFLTSFACIGALLLFVRVMVTRTTRSIKKVSQTAGNLARGIFGEPLEVTSRDEVGELIRNFNTMTSQLQKGVRLQEAMDIASEVQSTLLPQTDYSVNGVEVSGLSVYCDETGGDYFDFMPSDSNPGRLHVVVGDVVGHGIGAALLMATLRALVRANVDQPADPHTLISEVNRQLCRDTSELGNFASLFYLRIDTAKQVLQWVRAGHDPAILFAPLTGKFIELKGKGLVLGLDTGYQYQTNTFAFSGEQFILLIGSDGVWEAENENGEQFGKKRLKDIVQKNAHLSPRDLLHRITQSIEQFRGKATLSDDITLVALTIDGRSSEPGEME